MKLTRRQLKILIENYLLTEAVHDTAAAAVGLTDPDKIELLKIASDKPHSLQKAELVWIAKYFMTPEGMLDNDIETIVEKIKTFKRSKSALDRKKLPTELNKYNDLTTLSQALARSQGTLDDSELAKESDLIYESENWRVYLPHTREAACRLGAGTPWCTARTTGENMFYSYTFGSEILLFHVIKKETSELSVNPNYNKMTLSILPNKKDILWEKSTNTTVNFQNQPLTQDSFLEATGNEASGILSAIKNYHNTLEGKHPTLDKLYKFIEDPNQYLIENRGKSRLAIIEFTFAMIMAIKKREKRNIAFDNPELKENIRNSTLITVNDVQKLLSKSDFGETLGNLLKYRNLLNKVAEEEISRFEPGAYELLKEDPRFSLTAIKDFAEKLIVGFQNSPADMDDYEIFIPGDYDVNDNRLAGVGVDDVTNILELPVVVIVNFINYLGEPQEFEVAIWPPGAESEAPKGVDAVVLRTEDYYHYNDYEYNSSEFNFVDNPDQAIDAILAGIYEMLS